jgi:hypothetical protein
MAQRTEMWAIKSFRGHLMLFAVARTRSACIREWITQYCAPGATWKQRYRRGWRCVRVRLVEIK